jgi:hypothetical protein
MTAHSTLFSLEQITYASIQFLSESDVARELEDEDESLAQYMQALLDKPYLFAHVNAADHSGSFVTLLEEVTRQLGLSPCDNYLRDGKVKWLYWFEDMHYASRSNACGATIVVSNAMLLKDASPDFFFSMIQVFSSLVSHWTIEGKALKLIFEWHANPALTKIFAHALQARPAFTLRHDSERAKRDFEAFACDYEAGRIHFTVIGAAEVASGAESASQATYDTQSKNK